jgi:hypothetical protein
MQKVWRVDGIILEKFGKIQESQTRENANK